MSNSVPFRLVVVDGDPLLREQVARDIGLRQGVDVVATAMAARTALPKIEGHRPDLVLVDLATDSVQGLELVEWLRTAGMPVAVLGLIDAHTGAPRVRRAQELAVALVARPTDVGEVAFPAWLDHLYRRCRAQVEFARSNARPWPLTPVARPRPAERAVSSAPSSAGEPAARPGSAPPAPATPRLVDGHSSRRCAIEVVGIGISTGGPKALAVLLPMLPADLPVPVLIVQHMPPVFTARLAESLAQNCQLPVREARAGEPVRPGEVLIAPGGRHLAVRRGEQGMFVRISEEPPENSCRPSVDYLFRSLAEVYGASTCAVMMTGMGADGLRACRQLRAIGARIVAQDESSCTVFGMPRGPIEAGLVEVVAPLDQLAARIVALVHVAPR